MVAILGPSGSGKTSLLNFLAQRLILSPGNKNEGEVFANGRKVEANDFGKFGAFVQQDDILIETMTPKSCLEFAAKMRTTLSPYKQQAKVLAIL